MYTVVAHHIFVVTRYGSLVNKFKYVAGVRDWGVISLKKKKKKTNAQSFECYCLLRWKLIDEENVTERYRGFKG